MTSPAAKRRERRRPHSTPRLTTALSAALVALTLLTVATAGTGSASAASVPSSTSRPADTVVMVLTPFLTWSDITSATPALASAVDQGALANMNAVTGDYGWPTVAGGALTISASRWTAGPVGVPAEPSELSAIASANANSLNPPTVGALGDALHAAGLKTAAVGNADEDTSTPAGISRPAALAAMDHTGRVDLNFTSPALLSAAPSWPFGVRTDLRQMRMAVRIALVDHPALVVIDPGDLERAHDAPNLSPEQAAAAHRRAVRALDQLVSDLRLVIDGRTLLVLVAPVTEKPYYQPPYFGPTIVVGPGARGLLTSSSTQRPGLIANIDVAPTVLRALGLPASTAMLGQPMDSPAGGAGELGLADGFSPAQAVAALDRLGTSVGSVDYLRDLYFIPYFCWTAVAIAVIAALVALVGTLRRLSTIARLLLLLVLSVPPAAWTMFVIDRYPPTPVDALVAFVVSLVVLFAIVAGLSFALRVRDEVPILALATLTSLLVAADQWTGRPFETGLFSYSIRAGWRYYGMGNEGAALLVGASVLAVGITCDLVAETRWARAVRLGLMPLVGVIAIVTAAAPFAGANAGVALWGLVAYAVAWARINRARFNWQWVLGVLGAIVVVVGAFAALDALRGSGETHLGRFASELLGGDFATVGELVRRKAENNIGYFSQTPYTWVAAAIAVALASVRWLGSRPLARVLASRPALAGALLGVVVGSIVALLTEDSGIVMPALMLFAGALPTLYLVLARNSAE